MESMRSKIGVWHLGMANGNWSFGFTKSMVHCNALHCSALDVELFHLSGERELACRFWVPQLELLVTTAVNVERRAGVWRSREAVQ